LYAVPESEKDSSFTYTCVPLKSKTLSSGFRTDGAERLVSAVAAASSMSSSSDLSRDVSSEVPPDRINVWI